MGKRQHYQRTAHVHGFFNADGSSRYTCKWCGRTYDALTEAGMIRRGKDHHSGFRLPGKDTVDEVYRDRFVAAILR